MVMIVLQAGIDSQPAWPRAGGGGGFSGGSSSSNSSSYSSSSSSWGSGSSTWGSGGSTWGGGGSTWGGSSSSRSSGSSTWGGGGSSRSSNTWNSGGSFSGGGTSGFSEVPTLREFMVIVIVILAGVGLLLLNDLLSRDVYNDRRFEPSNRLPNDTSTGRYRGNQAKAISVMRQRDPQFDANAFLTRFRHAFMEIQQAWQNQDLTSIRHFVSDRLHERFSLQIQEQQDLGYRDSISNLKIIKADLVEAEPNSVFDVITIQVTASLVDYRVSIKDGSYISGDKSEETFTEFWSFIRRRGAILHKEGQGLIEGVCPACGDAISLNQFGKCRSCSSLVRNGEYDWVLSEITQESVWRPKTDSDFAIYDWYLSTRDPGFNMQHLEDRASVIYWRKAMADRMGSVKPLLKVACDEFCEKYQENFSSPAREGRKYQGNCSVGSVELRGIFPDQDHDLALVEIQYSHHHFMNASDNISDLGNWKRTSLLMVLYRQRGVVTDLKTSISSTSCPNCGASETDLASHACESCGTVVNDGSHDWVLQDILSPQAERAAELLRAAERIRSEETANLPQLSSKLRPNSNVIQTSEPRHLNAEQGFIWLVKAAYSDGVIDDREKQVLVNIAQRGGISAVVVDNMMREAESGTLSFPVPSDRKTAKRWLGDVVELALVDRVVAKGESEILVQLGKSAGLSAADVRLVIARQAAERGSISQT